ncbi:hypothetical protein C5472_19325 [Photorhabdus sp. RW14-46]|nr:hypothetical protein [Photorhabdus sp. RW14-46]
MKLGLVERKRSHIRNYVQRNKKLVIFTNPDLGNPVPRVATVPEINIKTTPVVKGEHKKPWGNRLNALRIRINELAGVRLMVLH